jgi:hypothetical protein
MPDLQSHRMITFGQHYFIQPPGESIIECELDVCLPIAPDILFRHEGDAALSRATSALQSGFRRVGRAALLRSPFGLKPALQVFIGPSRTTAAIALPFPDFAQVQFTSIVDFGAGSCFEKLLLKTAVAVYITQ